jgi:hypothetical protein
MVGSIVTTGRRATGRRAGWVVSVLVLITAVLAGASPAAAAPDTGIVGSVVKAPITPDGDVAGAPTDFVINFDTSMDPIVPGRTLLAGDTIKVTLPDDFVRLVGPVQNPGPGGCNAASGTCSTAVLLQGWPQHPIPPTIGAGNYTVGAEDNTIVFTALKDLTPDTPNEPGIKQAHLILRTFVNPGPGRYEFAVAAQTGAGGATETGVAVVHVRPKPRASINVTSVFNAGNPNTIYQQTSPGDPTPLDWDFLVWDRRGEPAVGVDIRQINRNHALLVDGKRVVGQIRIDGPAGAAGQAITALGPSTPIDEGPVLGLPTARLTARFTAGDTPGRYTTTLSMNNGAGGVQMVVDVS